MRPNKTNLQYQLTFYLHAGSGSYSKCSADLEIVHIFTIWEQGCENGNNSILKYQNCAVIF